MFTGIIETVGILQGIEQEGTNRTFCIRAPFSGQIKVDQSIAHNGVCLTVTRVEENPEEGEKQYYVTLVEETLKKSNLGQLELGAKVNIERCMVVGGRLDGHFVQGHVDDTGTVESVEDRDGSWLIKFRFDPKHAALMVEKGSICINGVSLTVFDVGRNSFSVTLIPYTWELTNLHTLQAGSTVNLEFDVLGKYMQRIVALQGTT